MTNPGKLGFIAGRVARRWIPTAKQSGVLAGRFVHRVTPTSQQRGDFARRSGLFVKHVLPATVKPMHSLWHQILGLFFLFFAIGGIWWLFRHPAALDPVRLSFVIFFIVVMAGYGISSIRKSRRISRS